MKNPRNKILGKIGEEIATQFLQQKGYQIIERNFQKRYAEIDIVARDGNTLVFVEVKTRIGKQFGLPEEAITPWKMRRLIRSCQYYKLLHPYLPESLRIDVVSVLLLSEESVEKITHYKNVTG